MATETWMDEARQIAAQCWCDDETKNTVMDTVLAEAVAKRIAAWMDAAAHAQRGVEYYRGLLVRCGAALGQSARTADDGSNSEDVLVAKVPELVEALASLLRAAKCPTCDGSGVYAACCGQPHRRQTGEDSFETECCGSPEPQQCQWCDERNGLCGISPTP